MSDTYVIRQVATDRFEIAKFSYNKEPDEVYSLRYTASRDYWFCSCPGFYRQKDKAQHKHIQLVKFWIENLDKTAGYALWQTNDRIEFERFINVES